MLPTRPRPVRRSTCSSCTTPCWITATRVSCVVTLSSISSLTAGMCEQRSASEFSEQCVGFEQRQSHHAGVAAADVADEHRSPTLNGIAAGLVQRLAAGDVLANFLILDIAHVYPCGGQCQLEL